MKKILIKLSLILILIAALVFAEVRFLAPQRFQTRLYPVSSSKIPASFDSISIALISDLDGDITALEKSIAAINKSQSDFVIMMASTHHDTMSEEELLAFDALLASITPIYGKFAITDEEADKVKLKALGYQVLGDSNLKLHTDNEESITLLTEVSAHSNDRDIADSFSLLVKTHHDSPTDERIDLTIQSIQDYQMVSIPGVLNPYNKKLATPGGTLLTHMGSNTQEEARLFSNPEIIIVTLKSQ